MQNINVKLSKDQTYRHLFALCQNDALFTIIDYGDNMQEKDYERIVISDAQALEMGAHRAVIGTIRLLPSDNGTTVMFVNKDAIWHTEITKAGSELFLRFIDRAVKHFKELGFLVQQPDIQESKMGGVRNILFLAADPTNASRLRVGEEFREIKDEIAHGKYRDNIRLDLPQLSARPKDISQALLDVQPQIVHFSGHGSSKGALCFEDKNGEAYLVQPDALADLFEQFADQIECVVLNACYSIEQAKALARHIRFVIGMRQAISDRAAIAFAIGFYQALGAGRSIEEAYKLGCIQIRLENNPDYLTPVFIKDHDVSSLLSQASSLQSSSGRESSGTDSVIRSPAVIRPINLGFDGPVENGQPYGWFNSLYFVDGVSLNYLISVVPRSGEGSGSCALLQNLKANQDEFGSLMQRCSARFLAGKTIKLIGEIATKDVVQWSGLWLRADGKEIPTLFFDNMYGRPIRGSTSWAKYAIEAQLPEATFWLNFGIVLSGPGAIWADNFRLLVWENDAWKDV